jgi:hypothetical protein
VIVRTGNLITYFLISYRIYSDVFRRSGDGTSYSCENCLAEFRTLKVRQGKNFFPLPVPYFFLSHVPVLVFLALKGLCHELSSVTVIHWSVTPTPMTLDFIEGLHES